MKALFIHPEISRTKYNWVGIIENDCLDLEFLSAVFKEHGAEVDYWDGQIESRPCKEKIAEYRPDVVYVTGRPRQENFMIEYAVTAKALAREEARKEPLTILGGIHAVLSYERMYQDGVDVVVSSMDPHVVWEVTEAFYGEERVPFKDISGISYRDPKDGSWKKNPVTACDINTFPRADRTLFDTHPDRYRYLELEHAAWVRTALSCPFRCEFCMRNRMNQGVYSARDIRDVVDEIEELKADNIFLCDDDFLVDEKRVRQFVDLINERGIKKKYIVYGRVDFVAAHEELLREFHEAGLYYVLSGLEAVSQDRLDRYHKRTTDDINAKSVEICNRLGIHLMGMFILDLDFKRKDFKDIYRWSKDHHLAHVAVSIYTPEFGLPSYDRYKDRIITDNPSHFDYLHVVAKPDHMSVRRFYLYYYLLLIRLFLRAKREGVYDFIDYSGFIRSFILNIFRKKRENDDE
ncbi:MAG: radical SAM protein [Lachnospiraceae bacterium]|nr:radical SAM protein [Lachnospiraceae bacterium]